jgi:hypothetical protein
MKTRTNLLRAKMPELFDKKKKRKKKKVTYFFGRKKAKKEMNHGTKHSVKFCFSPYNVHRVASLYHTHLHGNLLHFHSHVINIFFITLRV